MFFARNSHLLFFLLGLSHLLQKLLVQSGFHERFLFVFELFNVILHFNLPFEVLLLYLPQLCHLKEVLLVSAQSLTHRQLELIIARFSGLTSLRVSDLVPTIWHYIRLILGVKVAGCSLIQGVTGTSTGHERIILWNV